VSREFDVTFNEDIIERSTRNPHFREVLSTAPHSQVVVMRIPGGGEIGDETHDDVDQILVFTAGEGVAILNGERSRVAAGRLVHVPAGTRHNIVNAGPDDLRLYTIYAPAEHTAGAVHHTRADAEAAEAASQA
jgi:mannose-6-phosphate isomerase-like protein (cupin superfamily)